MNGQMQANSYACGIYGYWFTKSFCVGNLTFIPRFSDYTQMKAEREKNKRRYVLTGLVTTTSPENSYQHDMAAVLTLVQRGDVLLTESKTLSDSDPDKALEDFPPDLYLARTRDAPSSVLLDDFFASDSHRSVVNSLFEKLRDTAFCESKKFRQLLFKVVETYRLREHYLDINYFLLYSGLEAYSRACKTYTGNNTSEPIAAQLRYLGFNVKQDDPRNLIRSVQTYTDLRNALFHEGKLSKTKNTNGSFVSVSMRDYYSPFCALVLFATLRAAGIDGVGLQWDGWATNQWR